MPRLLRFTVVAVTTILCLCGSSVSAAPVVFNYTGAVQTFTAPTTGTYSVVALGAAGGNGKYAGGAGASAAGDIFLTAGQILSLIVGGTGANAINTGGGGGGSFIIDAGTLFLVAGGGGGSGNNGAGGNSTGLDGDGLGGLGGPSDYFNGGGGAGFLGNGNNGIGSNSGAGGKNGSTYAGGAGFNATYAGSGGYGGGGGGGFVGGGGAGGYTGGIGGKGRTAIAAYGFGGDGGTSYFNSSYVTNFVLTGGFNSGVGSISIEAAAAAVPEIDPAGMASVMALVTGALGLFERRRRASIPA